MTDDQLLRAFDAPCRRLGLELDDVELNAGVLQVTVDSRGGGLDLDLLAELSKELSALLDERDELAPAGRYELEVSSPGLERRLRRPEQFRRALGCRVSVRTAPGTEGERRLEGLLRAADGARIVIKLDGGSERDLAYGEIERARTVFDWQGELSARRAAEKAEKAERSNAGPAPVEQSCPAGVPDAGAAVEDGKGGADSAARRRPQGSERERVAR